MQLMPGHVQILRLAVHTDGGAMYRHFSRDTTLGPCLRRGDERKRIPRLIRVPRIFALHNMNHVLADIFCMIGDALDGLR